MTKSVLFQQQTVEAAQQQFVLLFSSPVSGEQTAASRTVGLHFVTMNKLIEEYQSLAAICASTDYDDKKSIRKHNKSVDRMYEIVDLIGQQQSKEAPEDFVDLLDVKTNDTNIWAAIHLLERLTCNHKTQNKALKIIEVASKSESVDALGYRYWLKDWYNKNK